MSQISIAVNGRDYSIVCEDGQERHLTRLAEYIDRRIEELVESVGQIGDARLLLMAGLLIADELSDAYAELAALQGEERTDAVAALSESRRQSVIEEAAAASMDAVSKRLESIAARLEAT
jgi:cell division protein ZapA